MNDPHPTKQTVYKAAAGRRTARNTSEPYLACPFTAESLQELGLEVLALDVPASQLGSPQYVRDHLVAPRCGTITLADALRRARTAPPPDHVLLRAIDDDCLEPVVGAYALEGESAATRVTVVSSQDDGAVVVAGLHQALLTQPLEADPVLRAAGWVEINNGIARLVMQHRIPQASLEDMLKALVALGPVSLQDAPSAGRSQPAISRRLNRAANDGGAKAMIASAQAVLRGQPVPKNRGIDALIQAAIEKLPPNQIRTQIDYDALLKNIIHLGRESGSASLGWICQRCGVFEAPWPHLPPALRRTVSNGFHSEVDA